MKAIQFQNFEELKKYLNDNNLMDTNVFVNPDYVKSIIGIANDDQLVYSFDAMVEDLYMEYMEDESIEDPYQYALDWVEFNVINAKPAPSHIVIEPPYEGYDSLFETNGVDDFLNDYHSFAIGITDSDEIVLDADICDSDKKIINDFMSGFDNVKVIYL